MTPELDLVDTWETRRVGAAIADMVLPVWLVLEQIDDHFNPQTAPPHVVAWLAGCLGVDYDADPDQRQRQRTILQTASGIYQAWGTHRGLRLLVRAYLGVDDAAIEIHENGATSWSPVHGSELPGSADPYVHIQVRVPNPETVDTVRLDELIASAIPPHVPYRVDLR